MTPERGKEGAPPTNLFDITVPLILANGLPYETIRAFVPVWVSPDPETWDPDPGTWPGTATCLLPFRAPGFEASEGGATHVASVEVSGSALRDVIVKVTSRPVIVQPKGVDLVQTRVTTLLRDKSGQLVGSTTKYA